MRESEHYDLKLVEGSDIVNPLVQDVPNYETIDEEMFKNKVSGIHTATELLSGSVHALTRSFGDGAVFRFTATSNYVAGETFTVDAIQVTALLPNGEALGSGAYVIGSEVLCVLVGTRLTMFVPNENAYNAQRLGGEEPSYYGTATAVEQAQSLAEQTAQVAQETSEKVTGTLVPTELWTNENTGVLFSEQTITLSDLYTHYDYVEIIYVVSTQSSRLISTGLIPTASYFYGVLLYPDYINIRRNYTFTGNNKLTIENGVKYLAYNNPNGNLDNSYIIPYKVIGLKKNS